MMTALTDRRAEQRMTQTALAEAIVYDVGNLNRVLKGRQEMKDQAALARLVALYEGRAKVDLEPSGESIESAPTETAAQADSHAEAAVDPIESVTTGEIEEGAEAAMDASISSENNTQPTHNTHPGQIVVTEIRSEIPTRLNKTFLWKDGKVAKSSSAQMTKGTCQRVTVANLAEFAVLLDRQPANAALTYGVPEAEQSRIVAKKALTDEEGIITRSRQFFSFRRAPGIWMLDHDASGERRLSPEDLLTGIQTAAPMLDAAPMLWRASSSSNIVDPSGHDSGLKGQRLYLPVSDAALIPEAGKALVALLWASGAGWIEIGKAGQALQRTIVDANVWQPERLDFVAVPSLGPELTRATPPARLIGDPSGLFDLRALILAADGTVRAQADAAIKAAKSGASDALFEAREQWIEETAPSLAERASIPVETAKATLRKAATKHTLTGDFRLTCSDGTEVSVGQMLDNPAKWHGKHFADPLEPDYCNDQRIAWVNLRSGGRPYLYSHAHGGQRFYLSRPSKRIRLLRGDRARVVDNCLDLIRERGELFDFGDGAALVRITEDARALPVNRDWLNDHFDRVTEFYVEVERKKEGLPVIEEDPADAPQWTATRVMAKDGERGLQRLDAVITAPTLRRDGSILASPGYDAPSRLLLVSSSAELPHVPLSPSLDDAKRALERLWAPVAQFPLVDNVDRGVTLAGMFTACIRASLTTAPGFAWDAPTAGTGKTLLAQTIGAFFTGDIPPALPPASAQDEEARKRLFAALRDNHKTILWDNIREPFGNAALDAFLTAPTFTDRILGKSETATLPNRALFLATGNNLRLVGDTCRRILIARLDARIEKPYAREFDFDPAQMTIARRDELVVAALTIIRAWITAGRPRLGKGRSASFEGWDDLVRQPVCWVASWSQSVTFADPLIATERAFSVDPETAKLGALLEAVQTMYEHDTRSSHTVAQMSAWANGDTQMDSDARQEARQALRDALVEIAGDRANVINPRILGRWIERQAERRVGGLRLVKDGVLHKQNRWIVAADQSQRAGNNTQHPHNTHPDEKNHAKNGAGWEGEVGVMGEMGVYSGQVETLAAEVEGEL
ncbi:hypothetical protein [Thiocystis minor]|uniref:hypothetical protein n=1 Tax=Thiocystis minor TaxID=61597 RepID=UPI001A9171E7|nr:hypothetical protein [Thiocystis minor]